jgi:hypothetical protein
MRTTRYLLHHLLPPSDSPRTDNVTDWTIQVHADGVSAILRRIPDPEPTPIYDALYAEVRAAELEANRWRRVMDTLGERQGFRVVD